MTAPLLCLDGLRVAFPAGNGEVEALRGVDLSIGPGECLGLVGESGSGKSLSAFATMGLLPTQARVTGGKVMFAGHDLLEMNEREMERLRGNDLSMIFQEPMTALNPVMHVGEQIGAPLRRHLGLSRKAARERAIEQLDLVGIPDPGVRVDNFPHEMSGGMRQRTMIAMALACEPRLLIADEPTTALDTTIQAQIIELLNRLRSELGLSILMITHDLGVVAEMADRVAVMYGGQVVEECPVADLFDDPLHPYSKGLLRSTPDIDMPADSRLATISGAVPHLTELPSGCTFHPRCPESLDICSKQQPLEIRLGDSRRVACWARDGS
ncbi:ABC transporter ATP-binding protein [Hoeflea prorocentri]|uniref:ABC transporter ATP-binding protein n=1 Tax=Hoeflea prorocentri TaxID=1922333 RepID=A0A9X3UK54_9HYPH|nr:ABC transporter ATP-binding protein [Hoeflea prorocentri]MCY6381905.1 ABC transporter ATP-binding protein [Hoeflea prorocentri]MDA5399705.1 ABC transporter ATP-binding protein [Hoeflea prorocentri]